MYWRWTSTIWSSVMLGYNARMRFRQPWLDRLWLWLVGLSFVLVSMTWLYRLADAIGLIDITSP